MTKLLEETFDWLRQLPDSMQDSAARSMMSQLQEELEPGDAEDLAEGRRDFTRGDFVSLDKWRHEMGSTDR